MSKDTNIAAQQAFGDAVNSGNVEAFHDLVAANSVDHDPAPGQAPADEDNVAFAYTLTGTHQGTFQGHEATGKSFEVRGMQISRFVDGRMAERWGATDQATMMEQLGLS